MQKDGEDGRKKIATITRYVTVGLSLIEAAAMAIGFGNSGLLQKDSVVLDYIVVIVALTAGSAFVMWIGEQITEHGVGTDAQGCQTKAVLDGDEWVLNGSKCFITNGKVADVYIIIAITSITEDKRRI